MVGGLTCVCGSMTMACVYLWGLVRCVVVGDVEWCECEGGCVGGGRGMWVCVCGGWCLHVCVVWYV